MVDDAFWITNATLMCAKGTGWRSITLENLSNIVCKFCKCQITF